jgi:outer membrane protein assembly factor BamB
MGEVYEARDTSRDNCRVAIKFPRSNEPEASRRFRREIEASIRLKHANIVHAFEHGQEAGRLFLVMEFVHGKRLDELIQSEQPLPLARVARYLTGLAAGLEVAAQSRVVNRDIKPSNILIADDDQAKIVDYGLGLISDFDQGSFDTTRSGVTLGTPAYMAPEQFVDPHSATIAADVYALGCTIFYCLTARQPFLDLDLAGLHQRHATAPRPSICQTRSDIPEAFDRLVQRMMAVQPSKRPDPLEICQDVAVLLANGSHTPTPTAGVASSFDVRCPSCGELYHVDRSSLGMVLPCRNARCDPFKVEPNLIVSGQQTPQTVGPQFVEAMAVDDEDDDFDRMEWTSGNADVVAAGPAHDNTLHHVQGHAETVAHGGPAATSSDEGDFERALPPGQDRPDVVDAVADDDPFDTSPPEDTYYQPSAFPWRIALVAGVVLLGVFGVMGRMAYRRIYPPPEEVWDRIVADEFGLSHWELASANFAKLAQDYPAFPKNEYVPFFVELCDAQIAATTDPAQALLDRMNGIYKKYRDEEVYALYANYLYDLTERPVRRFLEEATRERNPAKIEQAKTAFELFSTVANSMKDDWVKDRIQKLDESLKDADAEVRRERARDLVLGDLKKLRESDATVDPDKAYARYDALRKEYPQLGKAKELEEALRQAEQFEVQQVTYEVAAQSPIESQDPPTTAQGREPSATLWLLNKQSLAQDKQMRASAVVLALARGVLYAFDERGTFLWARRLGIDCDGLPVRISETPTSPPLLLTASPGEGRLLALEERTGRVRWSYKLDGAVFTAPTIVPTLAADGDTVTRTCGLLPTATGEIHVLELVLGKRLGTIRVNKPLASGGKYDPLTRLVYFPAENKRLFAIDPKVLDDPSRPACRSVLFTNHPGGSLRSEPILAGPYLILNQAAGFDNTLLRVFRVHEGGFRSPHDAPLKEEALEGWTWLPPLVAPDRVTFVTDRGVVGAYGVNLNIDASEEEALYRMIDDPDAVKVDDDPARSLAVNSQEQLLWVVTGGKLQKRLLDVPSQRITTVWPKTGDSTSIEGIPVQESQTSSDGKTLYLTLMSPDGRGYTLSAVEAEGGKTLWSCALGHSLWSNPLVHDGHVLLVDHGGQIWRMKIPQGVVPADHVAPPFQPAVKGFSTAGMIASQFYLLGPAASPSHVVAVIDNGRRLAIFDVAQVLDPKRQQSAWNIVPLPASISGQPCLMGERLAVPCDDGNIQLCELNPQAPPAQLPTYRWRSADGLIGERPVLMSDGNQSLFILSDHGTVRRLALQRGDAGLWRFLEVGNAIKLTKAGFLPPDWSASNMLVADRDRTLHGVHWNDAAPEHWKVALPGRATMSPFVHGQSALVVLESRKVASIDIPSKELRWVSEPTPGRICGQPVASDEGLVVIDEAGQLTILNWDDGHTHRNRELPVAAGPATAAVPLGHDQFLVPLDDGTLLVLTSQAKPKHAEN